MGAALREGSFDMPKSKMPFSLLEQRAQAQDKGCVKLAYPKKGTPEYEAWILTSEYKKHCKKSSESRNGVRASNETRLKKSLVISGKNHPNFGGKFHTDDYLLKQVESHINGIWYGSVKYPKRKKYCNIFYKMRDEGRIGAFWNFESVLSGKTKDLCCHHIYYQPECEFEEDALGCYAWINIGANNHPKWYKYYIRGDPNKFVLLTRSENSMVNGNKLYWIKIFEDIIEANGGKCYLTKEEMKKYKAKVILPNTTIYIGDE